MLNEHSGRHPIDAGAVSFGTLDTKAAGISAGSGFAKLTSASYIRNMFKPFEFCVPTSRKIVPAGPDWLHEIKYDGYRLRLERDGKRVRLVTKGSYDWTARYP